MRILVLGVGNILRTDEAIGVRIVEALEQRYILPDYVAVSYTHLSDAPLWTG